MTSLAVRIRSLIRDVPDFPKKGILFKDITPLLLDAATFDRVLAALEEVARKRHTDVVAGIESRGFIFGAALAARLGRGFVPLRKAGKLPWKTVSQVVKLEYGRAVLEAHRDAVEKGRRALVVDDVLATGGTLAGACRLIERLGGVVAGAAVVVELSFLKGRAKLRGRAVDSLVTY